MRSRRGGIRTAKLAGGILTSFLLDGGDVVAEVQNNVLHTSYLRGINLICREQGTATQYYLFDAHADVIALTDEDGNVTKSYDYDAFGCEKQPDPLDTNPFRYCGEYFDIESGSYYLRARYYAPTVGRFISEDTIRGDFNNPLSLNLYTYCWNNAILYTDSSGHWPDPRDEIRALARWLIANPTIVNATQQGLVSDLFYLAGFTRDSHGIYHTRQDAWQQIGGYNSFYDTIFDYTTSMRSAKFNFTSGNREYILWAWKGDYLNLGAGAELGIYSNQTTLFGKYDVTSPLNNHWLVDTSIAMTMSLRLYDSKWNQLFSYSPNEKQWWITGFDPFLQSVQASDLIAVYTVTFNDQLMFNDFYKKYGIPSSAFFNRNWIFDEDSKTASFYF